MQSCGNKTFLSLTHSKDNFSASIAPDQRATHNQHILLEHKHSDHQSGLCKLGPRLGVGLHVDGRKDAAQRSCETALLCAGGDNILLDTIEMVEGKDSPAMQAAWLRMKGTASIDFPGMGLEEVISHIVSDCAGPSACARRSLEKTRGLLSIPFMAHLFSLIPKHLVSRANGVPWIIGLVDSFENITHVFRAWDKPKMPLRKLGAKMKRLINTRFFYIFAAIQHFREGKVLDLVLVIFASEEFKNWEASRDDADKVIITKAKSAAYNAEFPVGLSFIHELFSPWMQGRSAVSPPSNNSPPPHLALLTPPPFPKLCANSIVHVTTCRLYTSSSIRL